MASFNSISADKLVRLIGTPACPAIVDVREERLPLLPAALHRRVEDVADWAPEFAGRPTVVVCNLGIDRSAGAGAYLRGEGVDAEILEGGFSAWQTAGLPVIDPSKLPARDPRGRTVWVTRARPKVDRIACPWLIRRFVDPDAVFLFVAPSEVQAVAERFAATPFDVEGAEWGHHNDKCSFDALVDGLGLNGFEALDRLAVIVRGADTGKPELAPQSAGLLAASLGLSRMHSNDIDQLEAGMALYDALYRWCRDAVDETHDTISHTPRRGGSR